MNMFGSSYKNLLVSGCSFTHNNYHTPVSWANNLAHWAGLNIHNLAIPGAGNTHIKNSIILWLEQHKPNPKDLLIMVMWSGIERVDWITDPTLSNFKKAYQFTYDYSDCTELVVGGNWWANRQVSLVEQALKEYTKFQNNQSLALTSWLAMTQLTDYLRQRDYTFYYTAYQNLWCEGDKTNQWINYGIELEKLNLILDNAPWLFFDHKHFLGTWVKTHNHLWEDNLHPSHIGHELWCQEVLIPLLIEKKALYELTTQ
jgi:hypothetical protein